MRRHYEPCTPVNNRGKKLIVGLIIMFVGFIFLLDNIGILPSSAKDIIISWPMLIIGIGLINLFGRGSYFAGLVIIMVGLFFLLPKVFFFTFNFASLFWPVLLICIGLLVIFRRNVGAKYHMQAEARFTDQGTSSDSYLDEVNVFGGSKRNVVSQNFKGGKITSIFGGSELDFTNAQLAEGTNLLDMVCIFGGTSIIIPPDWNVRTEVVSILGGFADKRNNVPSPENKSRELVIKGVAIFGGGEIKSFKEKWY